MQTTTDDRLALNATGARVDADIRRYMGSLAGKNPDRFCAPSLEAIARTAWTSPLVVKEYLREFEKRGLIFSTVSEVNGESVVGWFVPPRKQRHPRTAAGFNGNDRNFLRACGIMTEG